MNLLTHITSRFIPSSILIFALTLSGCGGGGGGGGGGNSSPTTITPLPSSSIAITASSVSSSSSSLSEIKNKGTTTIFTNAKSNLVASTSYPNGELFAALTLEDDQLVYSYTDSRGLNYVLYYDNLVGIYAFQTSDAAIIATKFGTNNNIVEMMIVDKNNISTKYQTPLTTAITKPNSSKCTANSVEVNSLAATIHCNFMNSLSLMHPSFSAINDALSQISKQSDSDINNLSNTFSEIGAQIISNAADLANNLVTPDTSNQNIPAVMNDTPVVVDPFEDNIKNQIKLAENSGNSTPINNTDYVTQASTKKYITISVAGLNRLNKKSPVGKLMVGDSTGIIDTPIDTISITTDGTHTFPTPVNWNSATSIRIVAQPTGNASCKFTKQRQNHIDPYTNQLITDRTADIYCFEKMCGDVFYLGEAPAPQGLSATITQDLELRFSWKRDPWTIFYNVYYSTDPRVVVHDPMTLLAKDPVTGFTPNKITGELDFDPKGVDYYYAITSSYASPSDASPCQSNISPSIFVKAPSFSSSSSSSSSTILSPEVSSISPTTATLNEPTTFTVTGSNLVDGMRFTLDGCSGDEVIGSGTSSMRKFTCTPALSGINNGVLKLKVDGAVLKNFTVSVSEASLGNCEWDSSSNYFEGAVVSYEGKTYTLQEEYLFASIFPASFSNPKLGVSFNQWSEGGSCGPTPEVDIETTSCEKLPNGKASVKISGTVTVNGYGTAIVAWADDGGFGNTTNSFNYGIVDTGYEMICSGWQKFSSELLSNPNYSICIRKKGQPNTVKFTSRYTLRSGVADSIKFAALNVSTAILEKPNSIVGIPGSIVMPFGAEVSYTPMTCK